MMHDDCDNRGGACALCREYPTFAWMLSLALWHLQGQLDLAFPPEDQEWPRHRRPGDYRLAITRFG